MTEEARKLADNARASKYVDGPNPDGYFTAGIDMPCLDIFQKPDWHVHAIEFHSKDHDEAIVRRDTTLTALRAIKYSATRAALEQARYHIDAVLNLNEDNRLALAVQGRSLLKKIAAALRSQPGTLAREEVAKVELAYASTNKIAACRCGSFPTLYGDGAKPDDGYRSLWCQTCMAHVTEMMPSEREVIEHWNSLREQEHDAILALTPSHEVKTQYDPACMQAVMTNEPCKTTGDNHKRCTICGFIVDTSFEATKPTIDFSTAGRAKKSPEAGTQEPVADALENVADWCSTERGKLGAVDGYDYSSGEEYGLRRAEIELTRRIRVSRSVVSAAAHGATREALEFELKAAHNELEIADGEIERLKSLISKPVNKSMTNSGWGKEWPKQTIVYPATPDFPPIKFDGMVTVDLDKNGNITKEGEQLIIKEIKEKVYNNLSPTHDPYTNPNSIIYYQCKCGAILDCNTKSFAALNNYASAKSWKIRWGDNSYQPFCVECGKDVE